MEIITIDILNDSRSNCLSIMTRVRIKDYFSIIDKSYLDKGNIDFQREPLKTKSAIQIRQRMVDDVKSGAVLPPMVIGLIVKNEEFSNLEIVTKENFGVFIDSVLPENISLIDGMQRTTALKEAQISRDISENEIRVEFWIAIKINSLIYRMLILNSGQVPWNIRRQIEAVYNPLIQEITEKVQEVELLKIDDKGRRTQAGQFHAKDIIELFLVFGARKESVDTKERLADEFTKLDFLEATEKSHFTDKFIFVLNQLGLIDKEFCRFVGEDDNNKFSSGKDLFNSQPAKVGFIAAIARKMFGKPGNEYSIEKQEKNYASIETGIKDIVEKIKILDDQGIKAFLSFETLNEAISKKSSKVGLFEREFFLKAFESLVDDNFDLPSLESCWKAY